MVHPDAGMTHFGINLGKNDLNLRHKNGEYCAPQPWFASLRSVGAELMELV